MIFMLYTGFGLYCFLAGSDPWKYKSILSFGMWVANLGHGLTALAACFSQIGPPNVT